MKKPDPFEFHDAEIAAGTKHHFELRVARLASGSWATMPVVVCHGKNPGPTIWLSGALHGDELNGVEIIRRVVAVLNPRKLAGTVLAVPIVNVFGVAMESRYLPDRRDLNRAFPGSARGSMAARLAHLFFTTVVSRCSMGIDFHTGGGGRKNLPQLRCDLEDEQTLAWATAFHPPFMLHSLSRPGSLRQVASKHDIRTLVFEGGEASRFDDFAIEVGYNGALRVLRELKMIAEAPQARMVPIAISRSSTWVRSNRSGFCHLLVKLGQSVEVGQPVAEISFDVGANSQPVRAKKAGIVIGTLRTAIVHQGDALVHIAEVQS